MGSFGDRLSNSEMIKTITPQRTQMNTDCGFRMSLVTWPMTQENASINYVNWACELERHIHFHIDWITEIALSIPEAVDEIGNTYLEMTLKNGGYSEKYD